MKISWTGVAALAIAITGAVVAAALGSHELSVALGGLAVGLSTKLGAIGTPAKRPGDMPPFLALLIALSIGTTLVGCKPGVITEPEPASESEGGSE